MDMKPKTLYAQLVFLALSLQLSFGQVITDTVIDYGNINQTILEKVKQYGAENVLVVLDIDNTILTSDTDLGSDIWYQWQNDELDVKPTPEQKLAKDCLYKEAIGLLYELGRMSLTDSLLPGYIETWQKNGITLFALTSRSPDYRAATERELNRYDIHLNITELHTNEGERLILTDSVSKRKMSYINGIMMTSGLNKGLMLDSILDTAGMSFRSIIFVDDTPKNIEAVKANFSLYNASELVLFYYTKIITERLKRNNNMTLTPKQAKNMDQDWDKLIYELNTIFPERMEKSECAKQSQP